MATLPEKRRSPIPAWGFTLGELLLEAAVLRARVRSFGEASFRVRPKLSWSV